MRVAASGPPGSARPSAGDLMMTAPVACPAGARRLIRDRTGGDLGYLEHRRNLSLVRRVTALVGSGDAGVLAWTREPHLAAAAARRLSRITRHPWNAPAPLTTVLLGQVEAGDIVPLSGDPLAFRLSWRGEERLPIREAALLAVALDL